MEDGDPVHRCGIGQAADDVAGPGGLGVAGRGAHHTDGGIGPEAGDGGERTGGGLGQQRGQVALQAGQHHLGLGVTEAHVELEHLGARRR